MRIEFALGSLAWVLGLSGCADVPSRPGISEMQMVSGGQPITIDSLYCPATGPLLASGMVLTLSRLEGVILDSGDRGATWRLASIEPAAKGVPLSLFALPDESGRKTVYAYGYRAGEGVFAQIASTFSLQPGSWWATRDQGKSWHETAPRFQARSGIFLRSPIVTIADEAGTLVVASTEGEQVAVLRSIDSGRNWTKQALPRLLYVLSMVSDGRGHVVLSGVPPPRLAGPERSVIYWSADSGRTWQEGGGARIQALGNGGLNLYRSPQGAIVAFNSSETNSDFTGIHHSFDNGRTWSVSQGQDHSGRILGITGDSRGRLVAITEYDRLLLSDDGGASWRVQGKVSSNSTWSFNIEMTSAGDGTVVAMTGRGILRSTDRGETWATVESGLPDRRFGRIVHCEDGRGLIVMMASGMVTRSTDWGATWQPGRMMAPAGQH